MILLRDALAVPIMQDHFLLLDVCAKPPNFAVLSSMLMPWTFPGEIKRENNKLEKGLSSELDTCIFFLILT